MVISKTTVGENRAALGYSVFRPATVTASVSHEVEEVAFVIDGKGEFSGGGHRPFRGWRRPLHSTTHLACGCQHRRYRCDHGLRVSASGLSSDATAVGLFRKTSSGDREDDEPTLCRRVEILTSIYP
jgi:hypothetical protein